MNNLRELADEWDQRYSDVDIGNRMAAALRAQADAADKVREGLSASADKVLKGRSDDLIGTPFDKYSFQLIDEYGDEYYVLDLESATRFAMDIAAHYAPILAEVEQLRAENAVSLQNAGRYRALKELYRTARGHFANFGYMDWRDWDCRLDSIIAARGES